jgi:hypothetical protein
MTISASSNRISYAGNGATTAFAFPYKFLANADLVVLLVTDSTGASVTQVLTTNYTVTGAGDDAGGTVTMLVAPPSGYTLVIYSDPAVSQLLDLVDNGPMPAASYENALDKLTLVARRLKDRLDRAFQFVDSYTGSASANIPSPVANRILGWKSDASALENKLAADLSLTPLSAFIATLADDPDAETAQTTLAIPHTASTYLKRNAGNTAFETRTDLTLVDDLIANGSLIADLSTAGIAATISDDRDWRHKNLIWAGSAHRTPWQRGASIGVGAGTNAYTADGWQVVLSGAAAVSVIQTTDGPTTAQAGRYIPQCFHIDVTTADTAIGAGDYALIQHKIEGRDIAHMGFGQAGTRNMTLSFWVKSSLTGTHCVSFRNSAGDRSYVAEYTVSVADTWEKKTITFAVDGNGTWLYDTGAGLVVTFTLAAGSTFQTTAGAWAAGAFYGTASQVNLVGNVAYNFKLADIQLEAGSVATDFESMDYEAVFAKAQRYYNRMYWSVEGNCAAANTRTTCTGHFPVTMRTTPSRTRITTGSNSNIRGADPATYAVPTNLTETSATWSVEAAGAGNTTAVGFIDAFSSEL